MATRSDRRRGEAGLSVIEALIIVALTALIGVTLLGVSSRTAHRNFGLSDRTLDAAEAERAEGDARIILSSAIQSPPRDGAPAFTGDSDLVVVRTALSEQGTCAADGLQIVRLSIRRDALSCESGGRRRDLLRWARGRAAFSFSVDGRSWQPAWQDPLPGLDARPATHRAPLVRFELVLADGDRTSWIVQAGSSEPAVLALSPTGVAAP